jgi:GTP-binding protein
VLALNQWDRIQNKAELKGKLRESFIAVSSATKDLPLIFLSATQQTGLTELLDAIFEVVKRWETRIPTARLNQWLREITQLHPPPSSQLRHSKLKYITQKDIRPPTFVIFGTKIRDISAAYQRFLTNRLGEAFALKGVPIWLHFRQQENPYVKKTSGPSSVRKKITKKNEKIVRRR